MIEYPVGRERGCRHLAIASYRVSFSTLAKFPKQPQDAPGRILMSFHVLNSQKLNLGGNALQGGALWFDSNSSLSISDLNSKLQAACFDFEILLSGSYSEI